MKGREETVCIAIDFTLVRQQILHGQIGVAVMNEFTGWPKKVSHKILSISLPNI